MKTLIVTIIVFLMSSLSLAFASQSNKNNRGTKLHTPRVSCDNLTASLLASAAPDGTYDVLLDVILKDGSSVVVSNVTEKLKSLTEIDKRVMRSYVRCNPMSGLPELVVPAKKGNMLKVFTMDNSARLTMRLENK